MLLTYLFLASIVAIAIMTQKESLTAEQSEFIPVRIKNEK